MQKSLPQDPIPFKKPEGGTGGIPLYKVVRTGSLR